MTTRSKPAVSAPGAASRNSSRMRRLARLRTTAPPSFRDAMIPSRSWPSVFDLPIKVMGVEPTRRPVFCVTTNAAWSRRRSARRDEPGTGPAGLVDDEALAALGASWLEDKPAALGVHPLEESVGAPTAATIGLKRTLHGVSESSRSRATTVRANSWAGDWDR